jgi:LysM repeat protein
MRLPIRQGVMSRMHRRQSLPSVRIAALVALLAGAAVAIPAAATDRVVVVQPGDTLSEIALHYGVTVSQLQALNAIVDPNRIYPGQRLRLAGKPAAPAEPIAAEPKPVVHVVQPGEHLTGIAQRYGTTIGAIVRANGIDNPSYLRVGQRLAIPGVPAPMPPSASPIAVAPALPPRVHVVVAGENLTGIAQRYGTTIGAIVRANGIGNPSYLRVGQRLTVPGATALAANAGAAMSSAMAAKVAARSEVRAIISAEAQAQGVSVAFALAVAWQESGWQAGAVSSAGAVGVMQLTPPTAEWVAGSLLGGHVNLYDARSNVRAGIFLLRHYLTRYDGNKALVLAAYYQGQTAADRYGVYPMTRSYVASILALELIFAN